MSKKEQEAIAKKLLTVRRERRWNLRRMASAIGVSIATLSRAENAIFSSENSQSVFQIRKFLESVS